MKMKMDFGLKELERQFSLCIRCKRCTYGNWPENLPICPIYDKYKFFTYCGGGIIYLARAILLGLIEKENYDEVLKVISKCTSLVIVAKPVSWLRWRRLTKMLQI
jgi:hypothetical protein